MHTDPLLSSTYIKAEASRLGFLRCGIAPAQGVTTDFSERFKKWLDEGKHAGMQYLERHLDIRMDPQLLAEGCQSIVCVALNYCPEHPLKEDTYQLSWYAYGEDYHNVVKDKLTALLQRLQAVYPGLTGRICCDTAPLWERYWAWQSGLGWIGKHGGIVIPNTGSCFFLGELLLNYKTDAYDAPMEARCGHCRQCIAACPTGALQEGCALDARRCLSYLTIENREEIPHEYAKKMPPYIYGCDRCFKACPHLRKTGIPCDERFHPRRELSEMTPHDWHRLTEEHYQRLFKGSAVKRAKYQGLLRNIKAVTDNEEDSGKVL